MAFYDNFEQRGNDSSWDQTMVLEAIRLLLHELAPDAEVGQKYMMIYDVYDGTPTTGQIHVIKDDSGEWVLFSAE
jgi:hypothetical protein